MNYTKSRIEELEGTAKSQLIIICILVVVLIVILWTNLNLRLDKKQLSNDLVREASTGCYNGCFYAVQFDNPDKYDVKEQFVFSFCGEKCYNKYVNKSLSKNP